MPRRQSSCPTAELTSRSASVPNRPLNFAQPVCGFTDTSSTAVPMASRVPGGRFSLPRSVDEQLVARDVPAVSAARHEVGGASVHQRHLQLGVGGPVRRARAPRV